MDKNIPLSELIRIGAKVSGQCRHVFTDGRSKTCALGAAYLGKFGELPGPTPSVCRDLGISRSLVADIIERNDVYCMSRETIADWLEGQGL